MRDIGVWELAGKVEWEWGRLFLSGVEGVEEMVGELGGNGFGVMGKEDGNVDRGAGGDQEGNGVLVVTGVGGWVIGEVGDDLLDVDQMREEGK
ncbi:hypothetical protein, partial [Neisseria sicca]|uniref:hypothetical protein n=1 Tax=Neisseria sicca TaxID=490 RepID=UPI001C99F20A